MPTDIAEKEHSLPKNICPQTTRPHTVPKTISKRGNSRVRKEKEKNSLRRSSRQLSKNEKKGLRNARIMKLRSGENQ